MVPLDQANVVFPAKLPGILAVPAEELRIWLEKRREPPLRTAQIRRWIVQAGTSRSSK